MFTAPVAAQLAAAPDINAAVKDELRRTVRDLNAAWDAADRDALERLYAPEFVFVHGFGYADDRDTHIEEGLELRKRSPRRGPIEPSFDPPNVLLVQGDVAILRQRTPEGDRGSPTPLWSSTIYAKREGRWQIIQLQSTQLSRQRAAIDVSRATLETYVGRYDRGAGVFSDVSFEGGLLVIRHPALPRRALTPVSEGRFFDKADTEYIFERVGDHVHMIIRARTGQEFRATKQ